jgi:hypothetical protein
MNSERQKREQEIERLVQGAGLNPEAEVQFQEEIKKTASALFEEETRKLQKSERPKRRKWSVHIATIGLWLIALGVAGFVFDMPPLGATALLCGIAAILWDTVLKPSKKTKSPRVSSRRGPV